MSLSEENEILTRTEDPLLSSYSSSLNWKESLAGASIEQPGLKSPVDTPSINQNSDIILEDFNQFNTSNEASNAVEKQSQQNGNQLDLEDLQSLLGLPVSAFIAGDASPNSDDLASFSEFGDIADLDIQSSEGTSLPPLPPGPVAHESTATENSPNEESESEEPVITELSNINMDLSKKSRNFFYCSNEPEAHEAAEALTLLSGGALIVPDILESESESQDSSNATSVIVKRPRLEDNGSCSRSGDDGDAIQSGDTATTLKTKSSGNSRSSRRRKKKEFMHQKEDPSDPIAQRAKYAKSYRERKKQEHEVEVNGLKRDIAVRDAHIKHLESENEKMIEQLTKASLTRHETVKFGENIVSVIKAVESKTSTGINVVIQPALANLNSPKLSEKECEEIAKKSLDSQRFTIQFDYSETEKKVKAEGFPPKK